MKVVIQRVSQASVSVNGAVHNSINKGLLILVGIEAEDTEDLIPKIIAKINALRIFDDEEGKMNLSISDIQGEILLISQFTLCADIKKGRRPSYIHAMPPSEALIFFDKTVDEWQKSPIPVKTGKFGTHMEVSLINDGPVTITIDSSELF